MQTRFNVPIYSICWLNHCDGGVIKTLYEPESKDELLDICRTLYRNNKKFDVIGYTSNIYYLPSYNVETMVSTRKVKEIEEHEEYIIAACGVSVSKLARQKVSEGIKGFEGLIDLPGTVGASVYGNASCYGCSINELLISCELLCPDGHVKILNQNDLKLQKRSSVLKRGEQSGVILSVKLKKESGDVEILKKKAEQNHRRRKTTQPPPQNNLGSIYGVTNGWSLYSYLPRALAKVYSVILNILLKDKQMQKKKKKEFLFRILGAKEIVPYVYSWNRFMWIDEKSHSLFWKYHELHKKMFNESKFEIEIKK